MSLKDQRGIAFIVEILLVAVVLVVIVVASYVAMKPKKAINTKIVPQTSATPAAAGWSVYTSTAEPTLSFSYPPNWAKKTIGTVDPKNADGISLTSPSGTVVWWQSEVSGLGGGCDPTKPKYIRAADKIAGASDLYLEEVGETPAVTTKIGVVDRSGSSAPAVGPTDCLGYTLFRSSTRTDGGSPASMWLETNGPIAQSDIPVVRQILSSLKY